MQTKTNKISTEKASIYQNQHWKNVSIFLEDFICSFFKSSNEKIIYHHINGGNGEIISEKTSLVFPTRRFQGSIFINKLTFDLPSQTT